MPQYDPDARAYFQRVKDGSGTTISYSDKRDISDFIAAEKVAGRWPSAVEYWLCRSGQNAGTGTVLYGLKGSYDGALVNGPTWSIDGLVFDGINQYTELFDVRNETLEELTIATCFKNSDILIDTQCIFGAYNNSDGGFGVYTPIDSQIEKVAVINRYESANDLRAAQDNAAPVDEIVFIEQRSDSSLFEIVNNGSVAGNVNVSTYGPVVFNDRDWTLCLGRAGGGNFLYLNGEISFAAMYEKKVATVFANYQTTIGKGLGLP